MDGMLACSCGCTSISCLSYSELTTHHEGYSKVSRTDVTSDR